MIRKKVFLIIIIMLVIGSTFVSAVKINNNSYKKSYEKTSFSKEELARLINIINNVTDDELKKEIKNILDDIILENGEIDFKNLEIISKRYYEKVFGKIHSEKFIDQGNILCGLNNGTSTIYEPPYSNCFSWGEKTWGIDEYSHGCNSLSGAIGAYANAFVGGATAEAMQRLDIYVGRQKTLTINAKIIRTGGKLTFGFGSFAGTEKTWSWDNFQQNYHRSDVDPWWNWDIIILKIISMVSLLSGYTPNDISQAISLLSEIFDFNELENQLQDLLDNDDAEILHISFSFNALPGTHYIWTGLRATASACITGTGSAVTMGQVSKITVDGIACPESPTINGESSGEVGKYYLVSAISHDPNQDNIRYCINWGDGTNPEWTNYKDSGTEITKSHIYSKKGTYKIKVIVEDIDLMRSEAIKTLNINSENNKMKNQIYYRFFNSFFKKNIVSTLIYFFSFL